MVPTDHDQLTTAVEKIREELQALPEGADIARARVLARWTGVGLLSLGHHDDARVFLRQALDLAEASGNSRAVIATELNLADAYRYAGEADNADVLYRRALDGARGQHPELVDFALQHLGKHLMEQGSLTPARAHLREALRLRTAKGDAGLIESTQAAVDRVELLISHASARTAASEDGGAEAAQWSRRWTSWAPIPHHGPDVGSVGGRVSSSPGRRTRSHRARAGAAPPPA
ncbi:tetratricopeptide repeat protein [Streptomyces sp. NBC_01207]|uniref:tetratricopeptide repeat protein n=1 Tax=Streptomyces sp. NBC_01207 TaxID=2903772 RepID=UPI002E15EBA1|nr:tetratricopeptide repeat protein [Streptomyces sp. NBC_01207]